MNPFDTERWLIVIFRKLTLSINTRKLNNEYEFRLEK